ncbi:MAG TPA: MotA/TolQ/ExbB proton channel family protein [Bacillota bacterium]|nr:MotA/TolQ/ExbB proton channel family protein [Bacillota bacterium]
MLEMLLNLFTTEEKVQAMLDYSLIRLIFTLLIAGFFLTVIIHLALYFRVKRLNNYVKSTKRLDIEPLQTMVHRYHDGTNQHIPVETFIQEQFSKWKVFHIPVVSLMKMIRATISIFILLGVLGTFIGLTISLGAIQTEGEELVEHIVQVLSGIDVAFYTSIIGMSTSLIITLLIRIFNTEYLLTDLMLSVESVFAKEQQHGFGRLIEVTEGVQQSIDQLHETNERSMNEIVSSFTGFKDYTSGLQQSAKDLAIFNEGLSENLIQFQTLFQQMEKNTTAFQKGTDTMNENFASLINYFKGVDERNEYIASRLEQTFVNVEKTTESQERIGEQIEATVENMKQFSTSLLDHQKSIERQLTTVNRSLGEVAEEIKLHNNEFKRLFGDDVSKRLENVGQYVYDLAKQFDRLDESLFYLPEALQEVSQAYTTHKQLMDDRFHELKHFNETFHEHLRNHHIESVAFDQQLKQAKGSFEQIARENNQLLQTIGRTVGQFNDSFYEKEQTLELAVNRLQQTLEEYAERVEYSLGDKLQHIGDQLNHSTKQTADQMANEFMNIRRLQEQLNQEQSRSFQQIVQLLENNVRSLNQHMHATEQRVVAQQPIDQVGRNG